MKKVTKVLDADATCAGCGAFLRKGSVAVVYPLTKDTYHIECDEDLDVVCDEINQTLPEDIWEDILAELKLLNRILRRIYHCLARSQHKPNLCE